MGWRERCGKMHGLETELDLSTSDVPMGNEAALSLYSAARELLFTIVKHGKTRALPGLSLKQEDGLLEVLVVEDQGRWFLDPQRGGSAGIFRRPGPVQYPGTPPGPGWSYEDPVRSRPGHADNSVIPPGPAAITQRESIPGWAAKEPTP